MRVACFLLIATVCTAEPDFDGLCRRLASDDPAEREAARAAASNLDASNLPALEARAALEKDPEVVAALVGAAETIRRRVLAPEVSRMRKALRSSPRFALRQLARLEGEAVAVLHLILSDHEREAADDRFLREMLKAETPASVRHAHGLLAALSAEDYGAGAAGWATFVAHARGRSLLGVARESAVARGYHVNHADAERAMLDLVRLYRDAKGPDARAVASWLVERSVDAALAVGEDDDAMRALDEWRAVSRGRLHWHEERIRSEVTQDDLIARLSDPEPAAQRGALRALAAWSSTAFPEARPLMARHADLFPPLLPEKGANLTREELEALLSARKLKRFPVVVEDLAAPDVLEAVAQGAAGEEARLECLAALLRRNDPRTARVAELVLAGLRDRDAHELAGFAACVLARDGDDRQARLCAPLLRRRILGGRKRELGLLLAGRGLEEAVIYLRHAAAEEVLSPGDRRRIRELFDEAPQTDSLPDWEAWARRADARYRWNPETRRWTLR